jgi:hypothetical protein
MKTQRFYTNPVLALLLFTGSAFSQNGLYVEYNSNSNRGLHTIYEIGLSDFGNITRAVYRLPPIPELRSLRSATLITLNRQETPAVIITMDEKDKVYAETKTPEKKPAPLFSIKKVGEETVLGRKCTHSLVKSDGFTEDIWTTKEVTDYSKYAGELAKTGRLGTPDKFKALQDAGCGGLPVKIIHQGEKDGDYTIELMKAEKRTYTKAVFEIPKAYKKSLKPLSKSPEELLSMDPQDRRKYSEETKKDQPR